MKLHFLHISDFHFRKNWPEEVGIVFKGFADDIKLQASRFPELYCVFSGDSVNEGDDEVAYNDLLSKFDAELAKVGIPTEKRVCIPGNHDVARNALKPLLFIQNSTLSSIKDEETFICQLEKLNELVFDKKFSHYKQYEAKFGKYNCCNQRFGGNGWELEDDTGIYCLNTALCSSAGMEGDDGKRICDHGRLHIDTRSLSSWLTEKDYKTRILVMHHPLDWLTEWAQIELGRLINKYFHLAFCGHVHRSDAIFTSRGEGASVQCIAPPLFTRKSGNLGYSFVTLDTNTHEISVEYRQWTGGHKFVKGSVLAQNETGVVSFPRSLAATAIPTSPTISLGPLSTRAILQAEYEEAITCYSSKKKIWVDRDLASVAETSADRHRAEPLSSKKLAETFRRCLIRAPKNFGLTSLGRYIALHNHRQRADGKAIVMFDVTGMKIRPGAVAALVDLRCKELGIARQEIGGLIVDNWDSDKVGRRVIEDLKAEFAGIPVMLLQCHDDAVLINTALGSQSEDPFEILYLWTLSRTRIRELVSNYLCDLPHLEDEAVTKKIIADIDNLNIHRTPLNCLMLLKLVEQVFDDSPVNRTEVIDKVLHLLFYEFNAIPRYASRPDLKDCEYALGFLCEWLIRENKGSFTRFEFRRKIEEYCSHQILNLEVEVLLNFLITENILVQRGEMLWFRFSYWLYYFAAHRMHHDAEFSKYILSEQRYAASPEIIEFYTGIDRRRTDAVEQLTRDLQQLDSEFLNRTKIKPDFNAMDWARWEPSSEALADMQRSLASGLADSTLPQVVKDAVADKNYDRARPYRQELAKFVETASVMKMVRAMQAAARALRNSDYVSPEAKSELLQEVMKSWFRVSQVVMIVSRFLAEKQFATFEDMSFFLDPHAQWGKSPEDRWGEIISALPLNVVNWFEEDIFSKRMGGLLFNYMKSDPGLLKQCMVCLLLIRQRPTGWEREVERFVLAVDKNSTYLFSAYDILWDEMENASSNEETRQQLRRLASIALARHDKGVKVPNRELIERAGKAIDKGPEPRNIFRAPDSKK
jgi:hypothetical protein